MRKIRAPWNHPSPGFHRWWGSSSGFHRVFGGGLVQGFIGFLVGVSLGFWWGPGPGFHRWGSSPGFHRILGGGGKKEKCSETHFQS